MPDMWMDVDIALAEVPVNILPLTDDTDFKSREESVAYNAAGMELIWHFTTTAGATTATVVTPTTGGAYDWAHQDGGMYTIEIPASGGASINNDTEGFGWFTGVATGILPWRGPMIGFRAAGINNALIDGAWSATRGLGGPTALPDAAADAAGGLPISDAGGLDLDTYIKRLEAAFTSTIAGYLDAAISTRAPETGGNLADVKTAVGVAGAGLTAITGAKLHADYDAAKTAASQTSVNDIPTNTELATAFTEIKGATWAAETDTLEALRDRGDAAWVTATGFAVAGDKMDLVDAPNATALVAMAVALLDTLLSEGDADALNARTVRSALRAIRNKSGTVGGTLTVCKEDDTAAAWTAAVTEDASAEPITEIDPA